MDTADIPKDGPSDWRREPSERINALVLKLGEESGELAVRCCRAAMQGLREIDPDSGRTNLAHIEDEMADVRALMRLLNHYIETDVWGMQNRMDRKVQFKQPWFEKLPDSAALAVVRGEKG